MVPVTQKTKNYAESSLILGVPLRPICTAVLGKSKLTLFLFIIFTFIVANVNIGSDKSVKASPFLPISVTIVFHGDIIGDIT